MCTQMMEPIIVSFFRNAVSHESVTASVEQIVEGIRTGRWLNEVARIRQALVDGDKKQAGEWKRRLPYISFGGVFEGGHKASQLVQYSHLVVLDYDNLPPESLEPLREQAMAQPCVLTAFVTPSGRGLKVVVLTNGRQEEHARTFALVTDFFDTLLGVPSDPSCKDISRGHFVSADEKAVYRAAAEPFLIDELPQAGQLSASPALPLPEGTVETFVQSYLALYPATEGNRNNRLFRLSCEACKRGISQPLLQQAAIKALSSDDFDQREITSVVKSAYAHVAEKTSGKAVSNPQTSLKTHWCPPENDSADMEEDETADGEALREQTPTLPDSVLEALPDLLYAGLKYVCDKRERDMLLLAMITVVSSLLHNVTAYYARKRYWANLYCFVVAAAASNKGVLEHALSLCKHYFKEVADNNEQLESKYKKEVEAYEDACRQSRRGQKKSEGELPTLPDEPRYYYPLIPADISKSRLLIHQRDNQGKGGLMFDLEADTLSAAGKQDYGNFFDFLRKFFQHETTSASFKANGKPIYVYSPRLSVMLAGTPAQLCRMIPYSENGLFSRFLFYTHRQLARWLDVSPGKTEEEVETHFDQLAMRLYQMIRFLDSSPTRIHLTPEQWKRLNQTFGVLLQESVLQEREDFQSCIKRHGLMTLRICMVFSALEKAMLRMSAEEVTCSDAHFEAALSIVTCCLEHSRLLITSIKSLDSEAGELRNPYKAEQVFSHLPQRFTTAQFMALALQYELPKSSAQRVLKNSIGLRINKISKGVYECMPK